MDFVRPALGIALLLGNADDTADLLDGEAVTLGDLGDWTDWSKVEGVRPHPYEELVEQEKFLQSKLMKLVESGTQAYALAESRNFTPHENREILRRKFALCGSNDIQCISNRRATELLLSSGVLEEVTSLEYTESMMVKVKQFLSNGRMQLEYSAYTSITWLLYQTWMGFHVRK
ncbi:MAG: hypothetical protein MMC23_005267 [Stictis urceolatum]|nr:hypothetical protein [Stictis urceolata]